jgi:hypothetical protein
MFKKLIFTISVGMVGIFTLISMPNSTYATGDIITDTIEEPTISSEEALAIAETFDTTTSETVPADETPLPDEAAPSDEIESTGEVIPATDSTAENAEETVMNRFDAIVTSALTFIEEQFGVTIDRETVPLILSAAALILTVLLIIIINLIAHKKSRKIIEKSDRQELAAGLNANNFGDLNNRPDLASGLNEFRDL